MAIMAIGVIGAIGVTIQVIAAIEDIITIVVAGTNRYPIKLDLNGHSEPVEGALPARATAWRFFYFGFHPSLSITRP